MAVTRKPKSKKPIRRKLDRGATAAEAFNPSLRTLEFLVGEWVMEISNAPFLASPSDTANGHISIGLLEGGAFLVMRMGADPANAPEAVWLIGRDESSPDYQVLYYDSRKVSRVYEMSFSDGIWKMWRESPRFWQRYEGKFSKDTNTITGFWSKSNDGTSWEHDFDLKYTKVSERSRVTAKRGKA